MGLTAGDVLGMLTENLEHAPTVKPDGEDKAEATLWWDGGDYKITIEYKGVSNFQR